MNFLIGLGVVVAIVVIALVFFAKKMSDEARIFEERKVAREEAQERKKQEEDRLLAPKRLAFAPIRAEIKAQEGILATNLDYHYEHYNRLVGKDKPRLILYQQWLDDEDYKAGKLTDDREKRMIDNIVLHLKVLVGAAENLSEADREAYKSKQQALFAEAQKFGRTIMEHQHIQIAEERAREKRRLDFETTLFEALNPSGEKMAQELGYSGLKEMSDKLDLKRQGLEPPPDTPGIAAAKVGMAVFSIANLIAVSDVMGKALPTTERLDAQASKYLRENPNVVTAEVLASLCASAEKSAYEFVRDSIDRALSTYRSMKWEIDYPFEKWAESYRIRLRKPRTEENFRTHLSMVA